MSSSSSGGGDARRRRRLGPALTQRHILPTRTGADSATYLADSDAGAADSDLAVPGTRRRVHLQHLRARRVSTSEAVYVLWRFGSGSSRTVANNRNAGDPKRSFHSQTRKDCKYVTHFLFSFLLLDNTGLDDMCSSRLVRLINRLAVV
eukprot:1192864-Prorocentrum_minimum.AAC.1